MNISPFSVQKKGEAYGSNSFTDSRVTKTINRIHDGMINLLKTKAYNDITVKDICEKSQISRTTFYTHYKTKDDFIYSYLNTLLKEAKKKFLKSETLTQAIFLKKMIYFWLSEGQLILMLLGDESAYKLHQVIKNHYNNVSKLMLYQY